MESSLQKIIGYIISVLILFIIPLYISFEKVDEVSYNIVLKSTQNFVDNVRDKGYISPDMYNKFVSNVYATNNSYDIQIEHVKKRYDPAIYIYDKNGNILHVLDYEKYTNEDGTIQDEIAVKEGIYNQINSTINVTDGTIKRIDGELIKYNKVLSDGTQEETTSAEDLYRDKIKEYRDYEKNGHGRIVMDKGEIYADREKVAKFDEDVYVDSNINLDNGVINITNKQSSGDAIEPNALNYDKFIKSFDNPFNLQLNGSTSKYFNATTYDNNNSEIKITKASMWYDDKKYEASTVTDEKRYYDYIGEYNFKKSSNGRIVFDSGNVYADEETVNVVGGKIDSELDILSNIVFKGKIYNNDNSQINIQRAAIWQKNEGKQVYSDLTETEKNDAEKNFDKKINELNNNGAIVENKGKIYSETSSTHYEPLTDFISNISVEGTIRVKSPKTWKSTSLKFDENVEKFRNLENDDRIVINSEETYVNGENGITITHTPLSIGGIELDYDTYIQDMRNEFVSQITVPDVYKFYSDKIYLATDNVNGVVLKIKDELGNTIYQENNISSIDKYLSYKSQIQAESIIIGDIFYGAYEGYNFELTEPTAIICEQNNGTTYDIINNVNEYINDYKNRSFIGISKTFNKNYDITTDEMLTIEKNGSLVKQFVKYDNPSEYDNYYLQYISASKSITLEEESYSLDEVQINYDRINIYYDTPGGTAIKTILPSDSKFSDYVEQYYNDKRIIVENSTIHYKSDLGVQYPMVYIRDKLGNEEYYYNSGTRDDNYKSYVEQYDNGQIIVDKDIEYTPLVNQVAFPEYILAKPIDTSKEMLEVNYKDSKYSDYLNQYNNTGKIVTALPDTKTTDNINVVDAKISIYEGSNSNPTYEIYEKNNYDLYHRYIDEYNDSGKVTIIYKESDVNVTREKINIQIIDEDLPVSERGTIIEEDPVHDPDYTHSSYKKIKDEFLSKGMITYEGAEIYNAEELEVVDSVVEIINKQTGQVIHNYTVNTDQENVFEEFDKRKGEFNNNNFEITHKETKYINGDNCVIAKGYVINEERITDKQILQKIFQGTGISKDEFYLNYLAGNTNMYKSLGYVNENSYTMNEGDKIYVTVKNKNTTIASSLYNTFTANVGLEDVSKTYVSYGGNIKNDGATLLANNVGNVYSDMGVMLKYTGNVQEITLEPGNYQFECWGASGGGTNGGKGAYSLIKISLKELTSFYVYVGGEGSEYSYENSENGGWNGGGNSVQGFGGGGATDIRLVKGEWDNLESQLSRIIVAGGGGGSSKKNSEGEYGKGGAAGGETGNHGTTCSINNDYIGRGPNIGEILTSNGFVSELGGIAVEYTYELGRIGKGGTADYLGAGAGGAGYIGGSSSHNENAGGGGGSSYIYKGSIRNNGSTLDTQSKIWDKYADTYEESLSLKSLMHISLPKWKSIDYIEGNMKSGTASDVPNPFEYLHTSTLTGNEGNGFVLIKKI